MPIKKKLKKIAYSNKKCLLQKNAYSNNNKKLHISKHDASADTDAQADADRRPGREESDPDKQHVAQ